MANPPSWSSCRNHLDGWTTDPALHFRHIEKTEALIGNGLFRPPYGHLQPSAPSAARYLQKQDQVVLWDVLSGDFDPQVSPEECL